MTGFLIDYNGKTVELPVLLSWEVRHGIGTPCDCFEVRFLYEADMLPMLSDAIRFRGMYEGDTVFFGVVDEFEVTANESGLIVIVSGRGMAALLMDNEAAAAQYFYTSIQFILDQHVYPWGIQEVKVGQIPSVNIFTVSAGASQWKVLEDFVWFSGGIRPRFSKDGVLLLEKTPGKTHTIDSHTAIFSQKYREQRYGVISSALVTNKALGWQVTAENKAFLQKGGNARRVINVPRNTVYDTMRHTGEYQIARSMEEYIVCELTLYQQFAAFPGDRIQLQAGLIPGVSGEFLVGETCTFADVQGSGTTIVLLKTEE